DAPGRRGLLPESLDSCGVRQVGLDEKVPFALQRPPGGLRRLPARLVVKCNGEAARSQPGANGGANSTRSPGHQRSLHAPRLAPFRVAAYPHALLLRRCTRLCRGRRAVRIPCVTNVEPLAVFLLGDGEILPGLDHMTRL